jgi:uncharacterized RDD family membrane protein YckC
MSDFGAPPPPPPDDGGRSAWSREVDPYGGASGGAPLSEPPAETHAGFWIRFASAFIDGLILSAVGAVLGAGDGRLSLLSLVLAGGYFTYLHGSAAGQTVGNKLCNIRVADEANGAPLDYGRAALRWLMSYVSGIVLLLGYLWMLWDPKKQTWHDKVARSVVVRTQYYPPPGEFGRPAQR